MTHPRTQYLSKNFSAAFGPLAAGLVDVTVALFLVLGIVTSIFLILVFLEGWGGLFSIMDTARNLADARNGSAPSMSEEGYAGNILSVIIISLTALGLLAAFITLAAILGLNAHANTLRHQIRDDITESAYDVVRDMTHISSETYRAQIALDLSVHEWIARGGWIKDDHERPRALLRAYAHAESALREVQDAKQRMRSLEGRSRHLESVRQRISEVGDWLQWIEINTVNTRLFYLSSIYSEGILKDEEMVRRGIVPDAESARDDCEQAACQLEEYCSRSASGIGFEWFMFRETIIYARDRVGLADAEETRRDLEQLFEDVGRSTRRDKVRRTAWIGDRRADYTHIFRSEG